MFNKSTFNLLLVLIFSSLNSFSQVIDNGPCSSHSWEWANAIASENSYGNKDIASDHLGNVYVTGSFSNTLTLGEAVYESKGSEDIYLFKYNNAGLLLWATVIGSKGYDEVMAVLPDHQGNVYLTGSFTGTLEIQGQKILSTPHSPDIYLAKFNIYGDLVWLQRHGGEGYDHPGDLAVDGKNNLYLSGGFEGTAKIGGRLINSATKGNAFLLKFNASGRRVWLNQFGNVAPLKIKLDIKANNHIIVGGTFSNTLKIQRKALETGPHNAVFLAEFSTNGKLRWLKKATDGDAPSSLATIAIDGADALYIGGSFSGNTETSAFQVGDSLYLGSGGFLAKFSTRGSALWSRRVSTGFFNYISDITTDPNNNVFATGLLSNVMDFAGQSYSGFGGFIAKYDQNGEALKLWGTGNFSYEHTNFITSDPQGNLYCTGIFEGSISFGKDNLSVEGGHNDAYIARLNATASLLAYEPGTEASNISFTSISPSSVEISWKPGDGARRLVVMRKLSKTDAGTIKDGVTYHDGNGVYGKGSKTGSRQFVVYNGSGHTATVTGLIPKMRYSVAILEYNEEATCPASVNYKTDHFAQAYFGTKGPHAIVGNHPHGRPDHFGIYPNPVEEKMNIIFSTSSHGKREFSLIDQHGRLLHKFTADVKDGVTHFSVNLSRYHLKSGVYFLKVNDKNMKHDTFRLIKK